MHTGPLNLATLPRQILHRSELHKPKSRPFDAFAENNPAQIAISPAAHLEVDYRRYEHRSLPNADLPIQSHFCPFLDAYRRSDRGASPGAASCRALQEPKTSGRTSGPGPAWTHDAGRKGLDAKRCELDGERCDSTAGHSCDQDGGWPDGHSLVAGQLGDYQCARCEADLQQHGLSGWNRRSLQRGIQKLRSRSARRLVRR